MKAEIEKKKSNELAPAQDIDGLMKYALKEKTGMEQLEKLIEMKYRDEDRQSKKLFHVKLAELQGKLPIIKKQKAAKDKQGKAQYKYAPLEHIVKEVKDLIAEFGFSYFWTESVTPDVQNCKRITCHLCGHGHTLTSYIDLPIMNSSGWTNQIQQNGSTSTYGKRYSFISLLAIQVEGDDDDGKGVEGSKPKPEKKKPADNRTPEQIAEIKKEKTKLINKIADLLKLLNYTTKEQMKKATGLATTSGADIKSLTSIVVRLEKEMEGK